MTAMETFASSLHSKHRHILPNCVASKVQKLLQCRLQATSYNFSNDVANVVRRTSLMALEMSSL